MRTKQILAECGLGFIAQVCPHHDVFQLHVHYVCPMDVLFPVIWIFIHIHVVQDQLEEDELLRDGTKRVVEAEHVVSILSFNAGE